MTNQCKNCDHPFEGNYCNHCGQQADLRKIDFKFIFYDLQQGLFNFDSGLLYTIKELFSRPGHSIREFLEGKRIHHFKPVSLVVILATTHAFLLHYFGRDLFAIPETDGNEVVDHSIAVMNWMEAHYTLSVLAIIPFFSCASFLLFRKHGYSFSEHFIINTFISAQRLVVSIALLPIHLMWIQLRDLVNNLNLLCSLGMMCWVLVQCFRNLAWPKALFRALLSFVLGSTLFLLFFLLLAFLL